eukprot:gene28906-35911_t
MTERGAAVLGDALVENRSLKSLDMSWNLVGSRGAHSVAAGLAVHPCLRTVLFSHLGLGEMGSAYIATSLAENTTLNFVDLSDNNIRGLSCAVLASSLEARGHIDFLDLSGNPLGKSGATRLLRVFVGGFVDKVVLAGCNFVDVGNMTNIVNERNPNKTYKLVLSNPMDFQIACDLCRLWRMHGPGSWTGCYYNSHPFKLTEEKNWPECMPRAGNLTVRFVGARMVQTKIEPLTEDEFNNLWTCSGGAEATDEWK